MAVQAPMPRPRVSTATVVNPGFLNNCRQANLKSVMARIQGSRLHRCCNMFSGRKKGKTIITSYSSSAIKTRRFSQGRWDHNQETLTDRSPTSTREVSPIVCQPLHVGYRGPAICFFLPLTASEQRPKQVGGNGLAMGLSRHSGHRTLG